jgi:hypothetical protein
LTHDVGIEVLVAAAKMQRRTVGLRCAKMRRWLKSDGGRELESVGLRA